MARCAILTLRRHTLQCEFNQDVTEIVTDAIFDGAEGNRTSLDIELLDVSIDTCVCYIVLLFVTVLITGALPYLVPVIRFS